MCVVKIYFDLYIYNSFWRCNMHYFIVAYMLSPGHNPGTSGKSIVDSGEAQQENATDAPNWVRYTTIMGAPDHQIVCQAWCPQPQGQHFPINPDSRTSLLWHPVLVSFSYSGKPLVLFSHTASLRACISSVDTIAQAATRFSPRAARDASSLARSTIDWLIPFIAAQLFKMVSKVFPMSIW